MALTENEKAATFIGWEPDVSERRCSVCHVLEEEVEPRWRDGHMFGLANAPAPDMSKPENYMRALDNCHLWERCQECFGMEGVDDMRPLWNVQNNGKHGTGRTPTEALAALYDAENLKGEPDAQ